MLWSFVLVLDTFMSVICNTFLITLVLHCTIVIEKGKKDIWSILWFSFTPLYIWSYLV